MSAASSYTPYHPDFSPLGQSARSLTARWAGLEHLAKLTASLEAATQAREDRERAADQKGIKGKTILIIGDSNGPVSEVYNYFLWYACSFFAFAGLLDKATGRGNFRDHPPFQGIKLWRHKVAAHTSFADPKTDGPAVQLASIEVSPTWFHGKYVEGFAEYSYEGLGEARCNWKWTLTDVHQALRAYVAQALTTATATTTPHA